MQNKKAAALGLRVRTTTLKADLQELYSGVNNFTVAAILCVGGCLVSEILILLVFLGNFGHFFLSAGAAQWCSRGAWTIKIFKFVQNTSMRAKMVAISCGGPSKWGFGTFLRFFPSFVDDFHILQQVEPSGGILGPTSNCRYSSLHVSTRKILLTIISWTFLIKDQT